MAQNQNQAVDLPGEIVDTRRPNQATIIENALRCLQEHRPVYTTTIGVLQDITEEGDYLHDEMKELKIRHKNLYSSAVAALKALVELHKLGDQVTRELVEEMDEDKRDKVYMECESVLGGMIAVLDKVEEDIGYVPPEEGEEIVDDEESEEEDQAEGEGAEGGAVQDPR
ncbi:hypothetical protein N431DRAFT_454986 [Stipitochalara longipes BDJ]|nr:hypothetical protein N431DRAFT_454986 [Stipitochalara longipes BDJ]